MPDPCRPRAVPLTLCLLPGTIPGLDAETLSPQCLKEETEKRLYTGLPSEGFWEGPGAQDKEKSPRVEQIQVWGPVDPPAAVLLLWGGGREKLLNHPVPPLPQLPCLYRGFVEKFMGRSWEPLMGWSWLATSLLQVRHGTSGPPTWLIVLFFQVEGS